MCVMEMESNLVLNHIGLKFLVKMIKIEKIKNLKKKNQN